MTAPRLHVEHDALDATARAVVLALHGTLARRKNVRLAVAGGSVLPVLARVRELAQDMWLRVCLTWVDERRVPQADAASNIGAALRAGALDASPTLITLPLIQDHELGAPALACARVGSALANAFDGALDVTLLGLGEDGHIASLFPGMAWGDDGAPVLLVDGAPKPPPARITLSRSFIATAHTHVVYAVGAGKRDAIARSCARDMALPLTALVGDDGSGGHVQIFTDAAGAGA